ncbi:MAG: PadR family transcriptional regulator [Chloroflexota bacterium]
MTAVLGYALLGLLARGPLSGYDITGQLKHGVGPFWHARHSQIYPELARLEADGLVRHKRVAQHDRPDKKVFAVLPAGRVALADWVVSPLHTEPIRDELTLRAYSVWLADRGAAAVVFRAQEQQHLLQLARYEQIRVELEQVDGTRIYEASAPEFARYATLQRGLAHERELAAWCGWMADALGSPSDVRPTSDAST